MSYPEPAERAAKHVYIAGPMRGLPNHNYDTFRALAKVLREYGLADLGPIEVINPAENFDGNQSLDWTVYMLKDLGQLLGCDAIILLPGWEKSEGAQLELAVARAIGLAQYEAKPLGATAWHITPLELAGPGLPETIEQEARRLVYGDRAKTYGHPRGDFDRVAGMWSAITGADITAELVAIMMVAFKLARLSKSPEHRDSKVDTIGYVLCLDRLLDKEESK